MEPAVNRPTIQFELPHRDQAMMDRIMGLVRQSPTEFPAVVRQLPHVHPFLPGHYASEITIERATGGGWRYTVSYSSPTPAIRNLLAG